MRLDIRRNEVVHIDFGICFEQGQLLSLPEWVPFRLTREIIDAMGICGVEGHFRSSMETSMGVLRRRGDLVLSMLRTFLADPLARWQSILEKLVHKQGHGDTESSSGSGATPPVGVDDSEDSDVEEVSATSKRLVSRNETVRQTVEGAIGRVQAKLRGEDVTPGERQPIEVQVDALIREAQDPRRLCTMFDGWQMWM